MKTLLLSIARGPLFYVLASSSQAADADRRITYQEAAKLAVRAPKPEYPLAAREKKMMGGGVVVVRVDASGRVTSASMRQSTGSPPLDRAALAAFRRWQFKPSSPFYFWQPVVFTMDGYHY